MANGVSFSGSKLYHVTNKGIEERIVFNDRKDLGRFTDTLNYYRFKNQPSRFSFRKRETYQQKDLNLSPIVEIICFCLMPNHFHIVLKEIEDKGISTFLSKVLNSYTKYFNARNKRSGALFAGTFKTEKVDENNLIDVSKVIHTEPLRKNIVFNLSRFPFSSYHEYMGSQEGFCTKNTILKDFTSTEDYNNFLLEPDNLGLHSKLLFD